MKVYLVMQDIPYDSRDVVAIYADKDKAEAQALKLAAETPSWNYDVDEFEVEE